MPGRSMAVQLAVVVLAMQVSLCDAVATACSTPSASDRRCQPTDSPSVDPLPPPSVTSSPGNTAPYRAPPARYEVSCSTLPPLDGRQSNLLDVPPNVVLAD